MAENHNTTQKSIVAIPTVYKGIQLKSRMEAQCAYLFDKLGWAWEYEPKSFLLPNGLAYRPDFWLPQQKTFFECRGYKSDKGFKQISGFASFVRTQDAPDGIPPEIQHYVVLLAAQGGRATWAKSPDPIRSGLLLVFCGGCKCWQFADWLNPECISCGPRNILASQVICALNGKLYANGITSDAWDFDAILEAKGDE